MSKIARVTQRIFGSNSGANQVEQFGSLASGTPVYSTDISVLQSLSNYLVGWFGGVVGSNLPAIEDFNALHLIETQQLAYCFQAGVPEWDTGTIYYIGSIVNVAGVLYISITDGNTGNATSDTANWSPYSSDPVGSAKPYFGASKPRGYIFASGLTIGDGSSGGTERANADCLALFTLWWTDYTNTTLPIQDSSGGASTRGASAAADWAAHKRMSVPDLRGRIPVGRDDMGGTAANRITAGGCGIVGTTLGASGGEQTHVLITAELAAHSHGVTDPGHSHNMSTWQGTNSSDFARGDGTNVNITEQTASSVTGLTVNSAGSNTAHNNTQPTLIANYIIKL